MRAAIAGLVFSGLTGLAPFAAGQVVVLPGNVAVSLSGVSDDGTRFAGRGVGVHGAYFWDASHGFTFYDRRVGGDNSHPILSGDGSRIAAPSDALDSTLGHVVIATDSGGLTVQIGRAHV